MRIFNFISLIWLMCACLLPYNSNAPNGQEVVLIEATARTYKRCTEVLELLHKCNENLCKIKDYDKKLSKELEVEMFNLIENYNFGKRQMNRSDWPANLPFIIYNGDFSCLKTYKNV